MSAKAHTILERMPVIGRCAALLRQHYGVRLEQVIVYGSQARGDADAESDIDLLAVVRGAIRPGEEIDRLVDLLYPLQLESQQLISVIPASADAYARGEIQLYRNVQAEGVAV